MNQSQKRVQGKANRKKSNRTSGNNRNCNTKHARMRRSVQESSGGHARNSVRSRHYEKRLKKRRIQKAKQTAVMLCFLVVIIWLAYLIISGICSLFQNNLASSSGMKETVELKGEIEKMTVDSPKIDVNLLTVNKYSRPGTKLKKVNGIVIHYVGNPGTTAAQNRSYFENLKDTHETSASSHFVVGIEGEIVQCIPTSEIAYCSNQRNDDTIAIECCHKKKDGKFTEETYDSLVHLTAFLCCKYDLEIEDIIRHYDVTGKECPKYFVKHEEEWVQFKKDVVSFIEKNAHDK